jgi:hypothetical protein
MSYLDTLIEFTDFLYKKNGMNKQLNTFINWTPPVEADSPSASGILVLCRKRLLNTLLASVRSWKQLTLTQVI